MEGMGFYQERPPNDPVKRTAKDIFRMTVDETPLKFTEEKCYPIPLGCILVVNIRSLLWNPGILDQRWDHSGIVGIKRKITIVFN